MTCFLITGGSRGIGAAVAELAASKGHDVCINYVANEEAARSVVEKCVAHGVRALSVQGDMAVEADIIRLFDTCEKELGPITTFVNNAGILEQEGKLVDFSADRIARIVNLNTTGNILCAREAVRRMALSSGGKGGSIVNISSAAALLGSPNTYVDYAASKGAIDTLTKGLSLEVARDGLRVNGVRPGIIDTDIHASGGNPDRATKLADTVPMGRAGTPTEIAEAVIWLASDAASYVTGTTINVTGGR